MVCEKSVNRAKTVKKSIVLAHSKPQSGENGKIFIVLAHFKRKSGENNKKITVLARHAFEFSKKNYNFGLLSFTPKLYL